MILCAHTNVGFLNETSSHSCTGAHIYLSENDPFPCFDGAVLSIAQIIKFVMTSAAKAELAALFVTAWEMILYRQTLIDMGWPQPKSPIQTDNSIAAVLPTRLSRPPGQDDGYVLLVVTLPRLIKPIPLLLGRRI